MATAALDTVSGLRPRLPVVVAVATLVVMAFLPMAAMAQTAPASADGWRSDSTFSMAFLGRDGSQGPDRYRVTFSYGATFFGTAVNSMPLLTADEAVAILQDGYMATFPGRPFQNVQPDDEFDIQVPMGTIVAAQWRKKPGMIEYRSYRGDALELYTNWRSPILYRLIRVENPNKAEVVINRDLEIRSPDLAKAVYGYDRSDFTPDVLQVARARKALQENQTSITVDLTKAYLDDFPEIRDQGEPGGKTESGLDIYWFRSGESAQPLFRVDDAIGQATDPAGLPTVMRIYYYKNGTIRVYQRTDATVLLSDRQPRNDEWAKVYSQYGRLDPAPNRWEIGQPQEDAAAQELNSLGITVLRYEPKDQPKGNVFTQFFDWLISLMNRKDS